MIEIVRNKLAVTKAYNESDRIVILPKELPTRRELEKYQIDPSWFINPLQAYSRLHDIGHHRRVQIWTQIIAELFDERMGVTVNKTALGLAGLTHDIYRLDDLELFTGQRAHAHRSAQWVEENWKKFDSNLSEETVELICYLNRQHSEKNAEPGPHEKEMLVFLQADRLDIVRGPAFVWKFTPPLIKNAAKNVCTAVTKAQMLYPWTEELIPLAQELAIQSRQDMQKYRQDQSTAVLDAAEMIGIVKSI